MSDPGALEEWAKQNGCYEEIFGKPNKKTTIGSEKEEFGKTVAINEQRKEQVESKTIETEKTSIDNSTTINKLASLRKKIAHDIDETFGTHLEEKKIAKPIKKIEKAVSDKLFGKVNE